jgi:4-amino-4-deoxy-L-arabinose transferase-like glycosyltransferase
MPNFVYVYALLFRLTDYPFLVARLFSALCAVAISLIIFFVGRSLFPPDRNAVYLMIPVAIVILFTNSPLFADAASRAWNHAPATLCAVLAFLFYCRGIRRSISWKYLLLSGFCLGFAISTRLSFAPLVLPFIIAMFLPPVRVSEEKLSGLFAFAVGGLIASAPAIYFLIVHTDQFLFGNLGIQVVSTRWRVETDSQEAITFVEKLNYLAGVLSKPGNLLILVLAIFSMLTIKVKDFREVMRSRVELPLLLLLLPFLFIGSLAPTPSFRQYFFAPMAFVIVLVPYALSQSQLAHGHSLWVMPVILAAVLSFTYRTFPGTPESMASLSKPKTWYPMELHEHSTEIANLVRTNGAVGKILTLAPLYAVESKLAVYPQFVTGRFGWRVGHLMLPAERSRQSMVSPAEIESLLQQDRPGAILTYGEDDNLEEPLIRAAGKLGYQKKKLSDGRTLWIPTS